MRVKHYEKLNKALLAKVLAAIACDDKTGAKNQKRSEAKGHEGEFADEHKGTVKEKRDAAARVAKKEANIQKQYNSLSKKYSKDPSYTLWSTVFASRLIDELGVGYLSRYLASDTVFIPDETSSLRPESPTFVDDYGGAVSSLKAAVGGLDYFSEAVEKWRFGLDEEKAEIRDLIKKQQKILVEQEKKLAALKSKVEETREKKRADATSRREQAFKDWKQNRLHFEYDPLEGAFDGVTDIKGCADIVNKFSTDYGVTFGCVENANLGITYDSLSSYQTAVMADSMYGAAFMFKRYGKVFEKHGQDMYCVALQKVKKNEKGELNHGVVADVNSYGDNDQINWYTESTTMMPDWFLDTEHPNVILSSTSNDCVLTMMHEMVHSLDAILGQAVPEKSVLYQEHKASRRKWMSKADDVYRLSNAIFNAAVRDIDEAQLEETIEHCAGPYATTNTTEFLAECVSQCQLAELQGDYNALPWFMRRAYAGFRFACDNYKSAEEDENWFSQTLADLKGLK